MSKIKKAKDKIEVYPVIQSFDEIAEKEFLRTQLISDLTGLETWEAVDKAPSHVIELANHLLRHGWKQ